MANSMEGVRSTIVYDRRKMKAFKKVPFTPGEQPSCQLGHETLNGRVNCRTTLQEIISSKQFTLSTLSYSLLIEITVLEKILKNDLSALNFKTGAKLLSIYDSLQFG
jgi:hypothetical protein